MSNQDGDIEYRAATASQDGVIEYPTSVTSSNSANVYNPNQQTNQNAPPINTGVAQATFSGGDINYRAIPAKLSGVIVYPVPAAPATARQDGVIRYVNKTASLDGVIDYVYSESTTPVDPVDPPIDGAYNEDLVVTPLSLPYTTGNLVLFSTTLPTEHTPYIDLGTSLKWTPSVTINNPVTVGSNKGYDTIDVSIALPNDFIGDAINIVVSTPWDAVTSADSNIGTIWGVGLDNINQSILSVVPNLLNPLDYNYTADTFSVNRYPNYSERYVAVSDGYIPSGVIRVNNFRNTTHNGVIMNVKSGVSKPKYEAIKSNSTVVNTPWEGIQPLTKALTLTYGYGAQNFLVGGVVDLPFDYEPYVPPPVVTIEHPEYEVFRYMSNMLVYLEEDNSLVGVDNCSISYDLDTFTWKFTAQLASLADYTKVMPVGSVYQTIEVIMNTIKFRFFISNVTRNTEIASSGKVTTSYTATGYSMIMVLAAPYAGVRSYAASNAQSSAALCQQEVIDQGRNTLINWDAPIWTVPFGVHSYQSKTPVGAMLSIVNAVGCVMYPDPYLDEVTVMPYYRERPWLWSSIQPDHTMHIGQFLNDSSSVIPSDVPNAVFVYGEGTDGVGREVGISGTQATNVLPDVIDKYLTDNDAAVQRGITELAKASRIEELTLKTYVDTTTGLFYPRQVIEVTDWNNEVWYCQVMGTNITQSAIGSVIIQTLTVHKYHVA